MHFFILSPGRHVIGIQLILSGIVTAATPFTATDNFWFIFATRFVLGVLGVSLL